jgi:hypothetical protein
MVIFPRLISESVTLSKGEDYHLQDGDKFILFYGSLDKYTLDLPDGRRLKEEGIDLTGRR